MEAERPHARRSQGAHAWHEYFPCTGSIGEGAMQALPNAGTQLVDLAASPRLEYAIDFTTTGTYYLWMRARAAEAHDTSCHVGLLRDGEAPEVDTIALAGPTDWTWADTAVDGLHAACIHVEAPGVGLVSLWMRDDGLVVDRLLLTATSGAGIVGDGPPESPGGSLRVSITHALEMLSNGCAVTNEVFDATAAVSGGFPPYAWRIVGPSTYEASEAPSGGTCVWAAGPELQAQGVHRGASRDRGLRGQRAHPQRRAACHRRVRPVR
jgi:hypothetical protein